VDPEGFEAECRYPGEPERLDPMGRIVLVDGEARFAFGKHEGESVLSRRDYCQWVLSNGFPEATKAVIRRLLCEVKA